jgi:hypothetical protein
VDAWTVIHDAVYAVVPPVKIPLPSFCVFVLVAVGAALEIRSWRKHR